MSLKRPLKILVKPTKKEKFLADFKKLSTSMYETAAKKNNDYAVDDDPFNNFKEFGQMGIIIRMGDKWQRIKNILINQRKIQVVNETIEDTLLDLATYCILLILWLRNVSVQ